MLSGWSARTWAATTTVTVTSDPTDRSNSPATITKYCPAASTASGAARLRKARNPGGSVKLGFSMAIHTSSTASTTKIGALRATDRHSRAATEGRGGAAATPRRPAARRGHGRVGHAGAAPVAAGGRSRRRRA